MEHDLYHHIDKIITAAQALIGECDGCLSDKQTDFVRIILANAERFIHLATDFMSVPQAEITPEVRHELGNPLTPILGYSELLSMQLIHSMTPEQRQHVLTITSSTQELRRLVDDLLDQARKKSKRGRTGTLS
jgi:signal transduction histidine kinase